ncbi:M20/M25/M40 family metallo-hydrolase [Halobacillus litoralis]|uniref:M20/M25/M40 family metallo-hydrolase n=1 Tax=Halobacillus litoralis TaxID=45668 RepID=UPI001CFF50E1|nr:M20/M25/M40 family metallo-hydrolase [Halobacillus litoralis]WLR46630.1 M20/M25/M40 family metallo-hydrolase [Halobacillus litoralis]
MYNQIKDLPLSKQVEAISRALIEVESVNGTSGEANVANVIKKILLSFPYFSKHPEHTFEVHVPDDEHKRKNIFALLKSHKGHKQTIVYHAHMDTVGTDDYGSLKPSACDPTILENFFKNYAFDSKAREDAQSGEWLFGRGALDMKSGIAVHIANLLYFSEHIDELPGNLLLMINPDEESQHSGVISSIPELNRLKSEENLDYIMAVNTDFISPQYDQDPNRYIYTGSAGKLLPCFYIYGRETHVGDTLSGIDSTLVSAEINRRINNNLELTEDIKGEHILPPSCLYAKDQKERYNVQTAKSSQLYFNYFIYELSAKDVMDKLKVITEEACEEVTHKLASSYEAFTKQVGIPNYSQSWGIDVQTLEEYIQYLRSQGIEVADIIRKAGVQYKNLEPRIKGFKIVETLQLLDPDKKPRVLLFFGPPYLPHNYLQADNSRDQTLLEVIQANLSKTQEQTGESFAIKRFFPYLSDGSFLSLHESDEEISSLLQNFPDYEYTYPLPIKEIRDLNIPSVNMGVYGKDGHKWTERVHKPYSFDTLPMLIREISVELLSIYEHTSVKCFSSVH